MKISAVDEKKHRPVSFETVNLRLCYCQFFVLAWVWPGVKEAAWGRMGTPFLGPHLCNLLFPSLKECFVLWERTIPVRKDSFIHGNQLGNLNLWSKITAWLEKLQGPAAKLKGPTDF